MAAIHRLLCTHCTFGTSELESSTADNAAKVLGYSVRRSSLPDTDRGQLRTVFRGVERLLSYDLPKDAPAAKKESLDCESAPRRMVFLPNLGGWQAVAHVAYRTRDTAGRPGSYFADVLAARGDAANPPWSPLEVLQLWATAHDDATRAGWWCVSEEAIAELDGGGRWKPADSATPGDLRGDVLPLLDDRLLHAFLTAESGAIVEDRGGLVPDRWWAMPAAQRCELVAAMLHATIQSRKTGGKEHVVIAAEPSVAAILFYAVFRLLPPTLRPGIGFSTYESAPERPLTPLVATTFLDRESSSADLPPELAARGFTCNTFRDVSRFGRTQPIPEDGYLRRVVGLALAGEWAALDGFFAALDKQPRPDFKPLDELTRVEVFVSDYVASDRKRGKLGAEPDVKPGSEAERFRRSRLRALITEQADSRTQEWPSDLLRTAIRWLGDEFGPLWDEQGPAAAVLKRQLPRSEDELAKLFDAVKGSRSMPWNVVAEAVVATAKVVDRLPETFGQFVGKCQSGKAVDVTPLVQNVLQELAREDRVELVATAGPELVEPILGVVSDREKKAKGSSAELRLPLADLVAQKLKDTAIQEQASFLARHADLADIVAKSRRSDALAPAIDEFFSRLLWLTPRRAESSKPGEWLSAGGQSRTNNLQKWLRWGMPGSEPSCREWLEAWGKVHVSILNLKGEPEQAGWFSRRKPPADALKKFVEGYKTLREIQHAGKPAFDHPLKVFLAASFNGLEVDERLKPTIAKWLDEALADAKKARHEENNRQRGRRPKPSRFGLVISVIVSSLVVAGVLVAGVYFDWKFLPGGTSTELPKAASETHQKPETGEKSTVPIIAPPAPVVAPEPKLPEKKPQIVLTPDNLKLQAGFNNGKLEVTWDANIVKQSGTTARMEVLRPGGEWTDQHTDLKRDGMHQVDVTATGNYTVRVSWEGGRKEAEANASLKCASAPEIREAHVTVENGMPYFQAQVKAGESLRQHRDCRYTLVYGAESREEIGSVKVAEPVAEWQKIKLPLEKKSPVNIVSGSLGVCVTTSCCSGEKSQAVLGPHDIQKSLVDALSKKSIGDVPHVCPLPEQFQPGKETVILDLPWFVGVNSPTVTLDLLRPVGWQKRTPHDEGKYHELSLEPTAENPQEGILKRWLCLSGGKDKVPVGSFEIYVLRDKAWRPILRFKAIENTTDLIEKAYKRLRACKLCFLENKQPVATAQLLEPSQLGCMAIEISVNFDRDTNLPNHKASKPLPWCDEWALKPTLKSAAPAKAIKDGAYQLSLDGEKKRLTVTNGKTQAAGQIVISEEKTYIGNWYWGHDPKEPGIEVGKYKRNESTFSVAEAELARLQKDRANVPPDQKITRDHIDMQIARVTKQRDGLEKAFREEAPLREFLKGLSSIACDPLPWEMSWMVDETTRFGKVAVSNDIPGTLRVVSAFGTAGGKDEVRFQSGERSRPK